MIKKAKKALILILSIFLFSSCTYRSLVNVQKPQGESVSITISDNNAKYDGELLTVADSALFLAYDAKLLKISLSKIKSVFVHGFDLTSQKIAVMIPLVLVDALMVDALRGSELENSAWAVSFGALMPITVYTFITSGPKVSFSSPLDNGHIKKLNLYSRYPQGLSAEQWKKLLQFYTQEDFLTLSSVLK
ncbi:MAG: hypothetical protein ACE1ZM_03470 [Gammaproteobacteria bacterium]